MSMTDGRGHGRRAALQGCALTALGHDVLPALTGAIKTSWAMTGTIPCRLATGGHLVLRHGLSWQDVPQLGRKA